MCDNDGWQTDADAGDCCVRDDDDVRSDDDPAATADDDCVCWLKLPDPPEHGLPSFTRTGTATRRGELDD